MCTSRPYARRACPAVHSGFTLPGVHQKGRVEVAEPSDSKQKDERESAQARDARRERRSSSRVRDDQKSGQGSQSALSKLKMIERQRAQVRVSRDDD